MMARLYLIVAVVCLASFAAADNIVPSPFYPAEHRSDLKALQEQAALHGYDLQIVRRDTDAVESDVVEYDSAPVSISSLLWQLVPAPIVAVKTLVVKVFGLVLKLAKLLIPLKLVLLGMALVIGFCAFTPYCTLIIEEPIASKIRAYKSYLPYIDEIEYYVYDGIEKIQALQG